MATQLSVFVENRPGKIEAITGTLSAAGVNLLGITMASRGEFGVVKVLPDDQQAAYHALTAAGFTVTRRRVVVAILEDKPGSLHSLLAGLRRRRINIEDCYGFVLQAGKRAAVVLDVEDFPGAEQAMQEEGVQQLSDEQIRTL